MTLSRLKCFITMHLYWFLQMVRKALNFWLIERHGCLKPWPNNRNMPNQHIATLLGHRVAMCCDMLGVVCSSLKMVKFEPTTPNTSQHGGQTHAACCAQQCRNVLRWHVAIVWLGLDVYVAGLSILVQFDGDCDSYIYILGCFSVMVASYERDMSFAFWSSSCVSSKQERS